MQLPFQTLDYDFFINPASTSTRSKRPVPKSHVPLHSTSCLACSPIRCVKLIAFSNSVLTPHEEFKQLSTVPTSSALHFHLVTITLFSKIQRKKNWNKMHRIEITLICFNIFMTHHITHV